MNHVQGKIFVLAVGALSFLLLTSFIKQRFEKELPPLTHTGENMMACKINGKVIIAGQNLTNAAGVVNFSSSPDKDLLYISCEITSPHYEIELSIDYDDTLGVYPIICSYPYFGYFWDYTHSISPNDSNQFQPDISHPGSVTVTYNDGNIIAGTFAMEAVNRQGKVVHLTDGRFDIMAH